MSDPTLNERLGAVVLKLSTHVGSNSSLSVSRYDGIWRVSVGYPGSPDVLIQNSSLVTALERAAENLK